MDQVAEEPKSIKREPSSNNKPTYNGFHKSSNKPEDAPVSNTVSK